MLAHAGQRYARWLLAYDSKYTDNIHRQYETVSSSHSTCQTSVLSFEAKWRAATKPKSRSQQEALRQSLTTPEQRERANSNAARQNWKRVGEIARRAGADDPKDASDTDEDSSGEDHAENRKKRVEQRAEREKTAKMMDLQYFLEMVDQKHRYGSNLRAYHEQWKKAETNENFFYWLDYGEGRKFEHPTVSRERLEKEQVRYLSREERMNYLVTVDKEGRLVWAKNGYRINTTVDYKDSINGIVPVDDPTPAYGPNGQLISDGQSKTIRRSSMSSSSDSGSEHSDVEGEHYVNQDLNKSKGVSKIKHVSAATILNHLLRSSVKPNSWIFVRLSARATRSQLTMSRSQIRHSACISASSSPVLSSTVLSYMELAYRLQGSSRSRTGSYAVSLRSQVTTDRLRRTFARSYTLCRIMASTCRASLYQDHTLSWLVSKHMSRHARSSSTAWNMSKRQKPRSYIPRNTSERLKSRRTRARARRRNGKS
jgi:hypothetical protein